MQYIWQHITDILAGYNGSLPLAIYLKGYFKKFPKLGSRDRRILSDMAYCWYRAARAVQVNEVPERAAIIRCLQACYADKTLQILKEPTGLAGASVNVDLIAPQEVELSAGITRQQWLNAQLSLPHLFIRVRKDRPKIEGLLSAAGIAWQDVGNNCLAIANGTKIDQLLPADGYVVQDASSQAAGRYFKPLKGQLWWDCCSGAGGKSIQLLDQQPGIELTVSDIRPSILHNHRQRCALYGYKQVNYKVVDMSDAAGVAAAFKGRKFDRIICDVPCSGSGTFARSPEQLYFMTVEDQVKFPVLQLAIATNAAKNLKQGGVLYYITCSVFSNENEHVVWQLAQLTGLSVKSSALLNGTAMNADSLFIAELVRE